MGFRVVQACVTTNWLCDLRLVISCLWTPVSLSVEWGIISNSYLSGLLWGLNQTIYAKCLAQFLAQAKIQQIITAAVIQSNQVTLSLNHDYTRSFSNLYLFEIQVFCSLVFTTLVHGRETGISNNLKIKKKSFSS